MTSAQTRRTGRSQLVWLELALPHTVSPDAAIAALQSLAGLAHHPHLVLEAHGHAGCVSWRLGCRRTDISRVLAALRAHVPELLSTTMTTERTAPTRVAAVRIRGYRAGMVNTKAIEPATRGLLAALGQANLTEELILQLVLGPRANPRHVPAIASQSSRQVRLAQAKYDAYRFKCTVRISANAAPEAGQGNALDPARARRLIDGVASALRALEAPGVHLHLHRDSSARARRGAMPLLWLLELNIQEAACFLAWPIAADQRAQLPSLAPRHPRALPVRAQVAPDGRIVGDGLRPERPVALSRQDSLRHTQIIGPTGMGKSTLLANLALQDIAAGGGVVVIDPKADLVADVLARLPEERLGDVVILDPLDSAPVGLQPLGGTSPTAADLAAETLLGILRNLYPDAFGPMTADIVHGALLTLTRHGDGCLAMVPTLMASDALRRRIVAPLAAADPMGLGSFWASYDALSPSQQQQAIAPLMRRLRPILMRPGLRAIFGQRQPRFALSDVFTKNRILLVPLSKGTLGSEAASLAGSVLLGLLWQTALGRSAVPADQRHPVQIIVDEFADVLRLGTDVGEALAQARGLGVGFTIAQQHLGQAPRPLRQAVQANALTRICFALSDDDAKEMAANTSDLDADDFRSLPRYRAYARILSQGTVAPWCSIRTRPLADPIRGDAGVDHLRAASRTTYGQSRESIDADLLAFANAGTPTGGPVKAPGLGSPEEGRIGRSRPARGQGGPS